MSWKSSVYQNRMAISAVNTAGGATKDIDVVIPADWDEFWDVIDATGLELRVTLADGYTAVPYSVDDGAAGTFSRSARTGRVRIDGATVTGTATECVLLWLYYNTTSTQGTGAVATTIAAQLTGVIERGQPSTWVATATTPRPGLTRPRSTFGKGTADQANLWLDITQLLENRGTTSGGRYMFEEPVSVTYTVVDNAAAAQAGMIDTTMVRFVEIETGTGGRRLFLRLRVKAGTDATQYTAVAVITTATPLETPPHRIITARAGFRVSDNLET